MIVVAMTTVKVVVAVIAAGGVVVVVGVVGVVVAADPTLETTQNFKPLKPVRARATVLFRALGSQVCLGLRPQRGAPYGGAPTFSLTPKPGLQVWKP